MDASRFDAWTRRRFGAAAVGALAGLLGPVEGDDIRARNRRKKKRRNRKCEKLGTRCNPHNDKRVCCGPLFCQQVPELGGNRCCRTLFARCSRDADCCANLACRGDGERFCRSGP